MTSVFSSKVFNGEIFSSKLFSSTIFSPIEFSPLSFSPQLWLDASDASTITASFTDSITGDESDFEGGTDGAWVGLNGGSTSASATDPISGSYSLDVIATQDANSSQYAELAVSGLTIGRVYTLEFDGILLAGSFYKFKAFTFGIISDKTYTNATAETNSFEITATATSGVIRVYTDQNINDNFKLDNITLRSRKFVSQWDDKSGNNNHALQGTAAKQPITGARKVNSKNAIDYNGSSNLMNGTATIASLEWTSFHVIQRDLNSAKNNTLSYQGGSTATATFGNATNKLIIYDGGAILTSTTTIAEGVAYLASETRNSSGLHTLRVDGVDNGSAAGGTGVGSTAYQLGAHNNISHLNGLFCEVISFNRVLTANEIAQVESYLANKWGVSI